MKNCAGRLFVSCAAAAILGSVEAAAQTAVTTAQTIQATGTTVAPSPSDANVIEDPTTITTTTPATTVTVTGSGTAALTGANTYTGGTSIINGATLQVTADNNLGGAASAVTLGTPTTTGALDFSQTTTAVTSARGITLGGAGTIIAGPGAAWTLSGAIGGLGSLTVSAAPLNPGTSVSSPIQPTLVLSGSNIYTGGTTVIGGANLSIGADTNLGQVVSTGTLTLGNSSGSSGTLTLTNTTAVSSARGWVITGGSSDSLVTGSGSWTLTNNVTGAGTLTTTGAGAYVLDASGNALGNLTVGTSTTAGNVVIGDAASATANLDLNGGAGTATVTNGTLSGYGTITGNVVNNGGTVSPGGGGVATLTIAGSNGVGGNYTQTSHGTLAIEVESGNAPALKVGGTANLGGSLSLTAAGPLQAGTVQLITANNGFTGSFSSVNQLSAAYQQALQQTGDALDLVLTHEAKLPENPSVFPAISNVAIDDAQTANDTVLSRLTEARTSAAVDGLRIANPPHRSSTLSAYGPWFQAGGAFGSTGGSGSTPGYKLNGGGFMLGVDGQAAEGVVFGVALGDTRNFIAESGGASARVSSQRALVYGGWWVGSFAFDGTIGVGYVSNIASRPIPAISAGASSSFGGLELTGALQGSTSFDYQGFKITPAAGAKFALYKSRNATEGGAQGYDLTLKGQTQNSLRPFIAATAATSFDIGNRATLEPELRVEYEAETLDRSRAATVSVPYDTSTYQFDGIKPSSSRFTADLGLVLETSRNLSFYTDVGVLAAGSTTGTKVDAGVRYRF